MSYEPRTVEPDIVSKWPPTELSEGYNYGAVQENYVITDNSRILRVYYVQPLQHVTGMLMVYLPAERIAFQADLFTPMSRLERPSCRPCVASIPGFPISLWYLTARTSRRALISGAPTQGPSLRRVTPGG